MTNVKEEKKALLCQRRRLGKGEEGHDALCCSVIGRIVARLLCCDSSQEDGRRRSLDEKTNLNHTHDATAQR